MSADNSTDSEDYGQKVQGRCPACGSTGLFVGMGGYLTCPLIGCPNPSAPHEALKQPERCVTSAEPMPEPEVKVLVGRTYTALNNQWAEWNGQDYDTVIAKITKKREDHKPSDSPDEVVEVVVTRRARVHSIVTVEEVHNQQAGAQS